MDKRLLAAALAVLCALITWLLADLGLLPLFSRKVAVHTTNTERIGVLTSVREHVRRKQRDHLVWAEGNRDTPLYHQDSVLTLENSGAEVALDGNIKLSLAENTLVVIEKPLAQAGDGQILLRFAQGSLAAQFGGRKAQLLTKQFTVQASAHSKIELRRSDSEHFEVFVQKGDVEIKKSSGTVEKIKAGEVVKTDLAGETQTRQQLTANFAFADAPARVYTRRAPTLVTLRWTGEPTHLVAEALSGKKFEVSLAGLAQEVLLNLERDTYFFRLKREGEVSAQKKFEVFDAPEIRLISPLPRDRAIAGEPILFRWQSQSALKEFELELEPAGLTPQRHLVRDSFLKIKIDQSISEGQWRVRATDIDGYAVPPSDDSTFYNAADLFEAPRLKAPRIKEAPATETQDLRVPASTEPPPSSSNFQLPWWLRSFNTYAEGSTEALEIVLEWEPVSGADHYQIEIARDEHFRELIIAQKLMREIFVWKTTLAEKVYWRVAAGHSRGRLGHFSAPESFDLGALGSTAGSDAKMVQPGVSVRREVRAEVVRSAVVATAPAAPSSVNEPVQPKKSRFLIQNILTPPLLIPLTPEEAPPEPEPNGKWGLALEWRPYYARQLARAELNGQAKLSGLQFQNFKASVDLARFKGFQFSLSYEIDQSLWTERALEGLTASKLRLVDHRVELVSKSYVSPLELKLFYWRLSNIERSGPQSLAATTHEFFGGGAAWRWFDEPFDLTTGLNYGFSPEGTLVGIDLKSRISLYEAERFGFHFLPAVHYELFQKKSFGANQSLRIHLGLGFSF